MNKTSQLIFLLALNFYLGVHFIIQGRNIKRNPKTFLPYQDRLSLRLHKNANKEELENLEAYLRTPSRLKKHSTQNIAIGVFFVSWPFVVVIFYYVNIIFNK